MSPVRTYNTFYPGIKQDDFLTVGSNFIDSKNMDGIDRGYGIVLGPKTNEQFTSGVNAMRGFIDRSADPDNNWYFGDNGTIYDGTGVLLHTLADTTLDFVAGFLHVNNYYFVLKQGIDSLAGTIKLYKITTANANAGNWTGNLVDTGISMGDHDEVPPVLVVSRVLTYIGLNNGVLRLLSDINSSANFSNKDVIGITLQGTQYKVYDIDGNVYFWDGDTGNNPTSNQNLGYRARRVFQQGAFDHITAFTGDLNIGAGYDYALLSKKRISNRLNDNSGYKNKFDFSNEIGSTTVMDFAGGDLYIVSSDTTVGLYKYGTIEQGLAKGFNKIVSTASGGADIDEIFAIFHHPRTNKLFYTYKSGSVFGVDFIDLNSKETTKDGYLVSDVFSGGTAFDKKIQVIRFAKSFSNATNFVKLFKRINNASSWTEVSLTVNTTDEITRENIFNESDEWVDIQFKIEIHNDTESDTSPIFHELSFNYTVIKT